MKKKFKLFATIGSLCLAVAMMTIGVLAATSATFTVTSNVSFNAQNNIYATIQGTATQGTTKSFGPYKNYEGEVTEGSSFDEGFTTASFNPGDVVLTESAPSQVIEISISNDGSVDATAHKVITVSHDGTDVAQSDGKGYTLTYVFSGENNEIAKGETETLTITFTIYDFSKTIESTNIGCTITLGAK